MAKNVNIKFTTDTKEAESGLKKVTGELNKFSKQVKGTDLVKFGAAAGAVGVAFKAVTSAIKNTVATMKDLADTYRVQQKAEVQLEAAARNNPYLNKDSVAQLKAYASQMQSISTHGDEELLPMMARLAAAGRTQEEIQSIISAALDVEASGMMSLESAVNALNGTLEGNAGALGKQVKGMKELTAEQLKSGQGIELVANKFKGLSKEVASQTGSTEQLKNAWGDFKEILGKGIEDKLAPIRKSITSFITWATNALGTATGGTDTGSTREEKQTEYQRQINILEEEYNELKKVATSYDQQELNNISQKLGYYKTQLAILTQQAEVENKIAQAKAEQAKADEQLAQSTQAKNDANKIASGIIESNAKARNQELKALETKNKLLTEQGKGMSEEEIKQQKLNILMNSYVSLVTQSWTVTENNPAAKKLKKEIEDLAGSLNITSDEYEALKKAMEEVAKASSGDLVDGLKLQLANLKELGKGLDTNTELYKKYAETVKELEQQITQAQAQSISDRLSVINDYFTQYQNLTKDITGLIQQSNRQQTDNELGELSEQYTKGLISYEEYCDKKEQISKKAAQEQYKLDMFNWTSQLLTATANVAQGVSAALAQTPPYSYIAAGLTAAAGAVQLATITANKPKPPAFASGGIVGATMGADDTIATVRTGEMVLNAMQQRQLWNMANGISGMGINMPVTINNNASDKVNATASMSKNGLTVIISDIVNAQMQRGQFTNSMNIANSRANGVSLL